MSVVICKLYYFKHFILEAFYIRGVIFSYNHAHTHIVTVFKSTAFLLLIFGSNSVFKFFLILFFAVIFS